MGMDLLDIAFRLERALGVPLNIKEFSERISGRIQRELAEKRQWRGPAVGEMYEWVLDSVNRYAVPGTRIEELIAARVDKILAEYSHVPLADANPATPLDEMLDPTVRRRAWGAIREELSISLPWLGRSLAYQILLGASMYSTAGVLFARGLKCGSTEALATCAVAGLLLCIKLRLILGRSACSIPECVSTREKLVGWIVRRHFTATKLDQSDWKEQDIWIILRDVLVEVLMVNPDEVTPEARLVEDLGCE